MNEPRRGFGAACFAGLLAAEADVVCFMDCDGSLDGADLPKVATPVLEGRADLVMGRQAGRQQGHGRSTPASRTCVLGAALRARHRGTGTRHRPHEGGQEGSAPRAWDESTGVSAGRWRWWCGPPTRVGGLPRSMFRTIPASGVRRSPAP